MEFTPTAAVENTSGQGATAVVPEEIKGWSWAGFLMHWIWSIGMNTWIGLLALFGPITLIMMIVLGVKGNEWAWQNRKWESVDQFKQVQKIWTKWGIALVIVSVVMWIIYAVIIGMMVAHGWAGGHTPAFPQ
jgi:hypothetical protein